MMKEVFQFKLLEEIYLNRLVNVYDAGMNIIEGSTEHIADLKSWSDQLAKEKLIHYIDDQNTEAVLTNFGRYWMMKGGYQAYLKEGHFIKDHLVSDNGHSALLKKEKEDLVEARLKLTRYRLTAFWFTLVISIIGFLLSLLNLYLFFKVK